MRTFEQYNNGATKEHRDPARIQHDVDEIMTEMTQTIEAIQTKFSPGEMLDHMLPKLRGFSSGSSDFATNLGRSVRDNPIPAVLIGAGLGYLLLSNRREQASSSEAGSPLTTSVSSLSEESSPSTYSGPWNEEIYDTEAGPSAGGGSSLTEGAKDKVHALSDKAHSVVSGAKDRVSQMHLKERASHLGEQARMTGGRLAEGTRAGAERAREAVTNTWHEQPLMVGAICVAIGAALGSLLPISRREEQLMGSASDETKRRLGEVTRQKAEQITQQASTAVAGLTEGRADEEESTVSSTGTSTTFGSEDRNRNDLP